MLGSSSCLSKRISSAPMPSPAHSSTKLRQSNSSMYATMTKERMPWLRDLHDAQKRPRLDALASSSNLSPSSLCTLAAASSSTRGSWLVLVLVLVLVHALAHARAKAVACDGPLVLVRAEAVVADFGQRLLRKAARG